VPSDFGGAARGAERVSLRQRGPHHLSAPADATSRFESAGRDTFFTWRDSTRAPPPSRIHQIRFL
jgi:hypothetical protein